MIRRYVAEQIGKPADHVGAPDCLRPEDIADFQLDRVRRCVAYVADRSPYYRHALADMKVTADDLGCLADIMRLPFTEPGDVARAPYRFACLSEAEIVRPFTYVSSGTTGPRKRAFFSQNDLDRITDFMAAGMRTIAEPGDVVQIVLPAGRPNDLADLLAQGVSKMGGIAVVTGTAPLAVQMAAMALHRPKILFGSTSFVWRLTLEAEQQFDLPALGVRVVFVTSEPLALPMRQRLERAWRTEVVTHYGLTEMGLAVAVECQAGDGYHYNEADLLLEIVDPETGAPMPRGAEGEIVFTTLRREAMPLLRFRTHDLARQLATPCPCGGGMLKFGFVDRRREAIVELRGAQLYPALLDEALHRLDGVVEWRATLDRHLAATRLLVQVEQVPAGSLLEADVRDALLSIEPIRRSLETRVLDQFQIEFLPFGSLTRRANAKKLIVDERPIARSLAV